MYLNHYRAGSGRTLVLIHGIGSQWQMWEPVLERLLPERESVALDLPVRLRGRAHLGRSGPGGEDHSRRLLAIKPADGKLARS
jgi:pimeloyl-ACP methyl ester carboxylesterase